MTCKYCDRELSDMCSICLEEQHGPVPDQRQDVMQGLADALAVILEFHGKCGFKALDSLGQRSLDICITEARAALATAQRFTK